MHSIEIRFVIRLENILFTGMACTLQPGKFRDWGSEGVSWLRSAGAVKGLIGY